MTAELRESLTAAANLIEELVPWSEGGEDAAYDIRRYRDQRPERPIGPMQVRIWLQSFRNLDPAVQEALDLLA